MNRNLTDQHVHARIDEALDVDGMVAACRALVRIPSLSFEEADVAGALATELRRLGFDAVEIDANGNVIGRLIGSGGGPSLMINGHLDHVPAGGMSDPFCGRLVDAARWGEEGLAIYGRGTCDMKCNVVASAFAAAAIRSAGVRLRGDVILVADVAEEVDSPSGVASVVARGVGAEFGLSIESTRGHVHVGHRGKIDVEVTIEGRTAHASEPSNGVNAIERALPVLTALVDYAAGLCDDPLLGPATCTAFAIRSEPDNGTAVVPDRCILRIDRRYVRGETPSSCEAEIRALVGAALRDEPGSTFGLRVVTHYPLMFVDPESPIVRAAVEARAAALDRPSPIGAWRFGVNGTFMAAAGIPTVGLGPGNEAWAHTPDEHILVADLVEACRIWTRLIVNLCGRADDIEGQKS